MPTWEEDPASHRSQPNTGGLTGLKAAFPASGPRVASTNGDSMAECPATETV